MKLSIIVPIYKVEKTLRRCVDSIVSQAPDDFELLLVDDGSPDNSGRIADSMAEEDARIRVYHKSNGGLSDARNYALDRMTGDYVTFVDSDDELAPDTLGPLMHIVSRNADVDILEYPVKERQGRPDEHVFMPEGRVYKTPMEWLADKGLEHCWVCNKVFRAGLFDSVRFKKGKKYEDVYLIGDLISHCKTIATTRKGMYIYHWNSDGIVAQRDMHLLLEAQLSVVRQLNIDTRRPEWHRLYMNMLTAQLHSYASGGKLLLTSQRVNARSFDRRNDRIKALLLNFFGARGACILFKLATRAIRIKPHGL